MYHIFDIDGTTFTNDGMAMALSDYLQTFVQPEDLMYYDLSKVAENVSSRPFDYREFFEVYFQEVFMSGILIEGFLEYIQQIDKEKVFFVTARPKSYAKDTSKLFREVGLADYAESIHYVGEVQKNGSHDKDAHDLKLKLVHELIGDAPFVVYEDKPETVKVFAEAENVVVMIKHPYNENVLHNSPALSNYILPISNYLRMQHDQLPLMKGKENSNGI